MSRKLRSFAAQAATLAPTSLAYGAETRPFLAVDESLKSRHLWAAVGKLVGAGLASGGGTLWSEVYRRPDGAVVPFDVAGGKDGAVRTLRRNPMLRRQPCPDSEIVLCIIAHLHLHKHLFVLSADLGTQPDGLRTLLAQHVAPELKRQPQTLGITLVLSRHDTSEADYVSGIMNLFVAPTFAPGFQEILI